VYWGSTPVYYPNPPLYVDMLPKQNKKLNVITLNAIRMVLDYFTKVEDKSFPTGGIDASP